MGQQALQRCDLVYFNNYKVNYIYDNEKKCYKRFINDKPHINRISGETIYVKNIIVQFADTKIIDDVGRLDIRTTGSGKAYYISNGYLDEIHWKKDSRSQRTKYTLSDGAEFTINPGNTWIQIMPQWGKFICDDSQ